MCGFRSISHAEYANLLERAVDIANCPDQDVWLPFDISRPRTSLPRGTRRKLLIVPYEVEKQIPVHEDYIDKGVGTQVVTGTRVGPKRRTEDFTTHDVEVTRERVQKNGVNVVRRVEEPVDCVVRKHVSVTRMVRKYFIDYEMRPVERVVSMPADRILEKSGVRVDRHVDIQLMEVDEDHHYQIRGEPSRSGEACARARVIDDDTHGVILPRGTTTWYPEKQKKASRLHSTADPRSKTPRRANAHGYNGMDPGRYQSGHVLGHQGNRTPPPDLQRKDRHGMDPEARYHPGFEKYYTEFEKSTRLARLRNLTPPVDLQRNYSHEMGLATRYNPSYMSGAACRTGYDYPQQNSGTDSGTDSAADYPTDAAGGKKHGVPPATTEFRNDNVDLHAHVGPPPKLLFLRPDGEEWLDLPPQTGQPRNDHANVYQNEGQPERSQPPPQSSLQRTGSKSSLASDASYVTIRMNKAASHETIRNRPHR